MTTMVAHIAGRLAAVYDSASSWLGAAAVFLSTFYAGLYGLIGTIVAVCLLDLACGIIRSAVVEHKGVLSGRLVVFAEKSGVYMILFTAFALMDKALAVEDVWVCRTYTSLIVFSEILSMLANLTAAFPTFKAFALVRRLIASEVADKLKTDKAEVDEIINGKGKEGGNA